jgi:hypothetical protein
VGVGGREFFFILLERVFSLVASSSAIALHRNPPTDDRFSMHAHCQRWLPLVVRRRYPFFGFGYGGELSRFAFVDEEQTTAVERDRRAIVYLFDFRMMYFPTRP